MWRVFAEEIGIDVSNKRRDILTEFQAAQADAAKVSERPALSHLPSYWHPYSGGCYNPALEVDTGISAEEIRELSGTLTRYPPDFRIHAKVKTILEHRAQIGGRKAPD